MKLRWASLQLLFGAVSLQLARSSILSIAYETNTKDGHRAGIVTLSESLSWENAKTLARSLTAPNGMQGHIPTITLVSFRQRHEIRVTFFLRTEEENMFFAQFVSESALLYPLAAHDLVNAVDSIEKTFNMKQSNQSCFI